MTDFEIVREGFQMGPINLTIDDHQKLLVYGLNGVGKTTLLLGILGTLKTRGSLMIDEAEISSFPIEKRGVAYQPANPAMIPHLKVKEILKLADPYHDNQLVKELKLAALLDVKGDKLSAGQARLIQIAAVLLSKAKVVLLDEPFSFLSEEYRNSVFDLIMNDRKVVIATAQERDERFDAFLHLTRDPASH
ncbi:MAG: ATP-binding cassette domain-containing protein [Nitrososphaerota archaeon]|jgi:ABC-type multidrug transport system ATPase subunit|nr:ATP-binding cassette domain-containing protein [Nitrososphaerota archaeon]MDG6930982.1 ATP-binding cassette domain-containing protein [Nitrososphaerota archaeon]MDG6944228.1 ATP-binding cassette domain-containing protein [Nitrososphaerota archaeon]